MKFLVLVFVVVASVGALPVNQEWVLPDGSRLGPSAILRKDGTYELFSLDFVQNIASIGPAGIVLKTGENIQFDENLHRVKRSGTNIINESGMLTYWGLPVLFKEPYTTILLDGPSAYVLSDGQLIQKPPKN